VTARPGWIERQLFAPPAAREHAYDDSPIQLPFGQTISQPYMVALTCEALRLEGGERVLDVGTGSGYAAAVLAELAGEVHTVERIPQLVAWARSSLTEAGYERVQVHEGDGARGLPEWAPFDAIAVAAAARVVPEPLWDELRAGGRIALPLRTGRRAQHLCVLERTRDGPRLLASVPARFVPLVVE
jgi:protein-L-isoaspartate(D-aspartate) O-methyltransferase